MRTAPDPSFASAGLTDVYDALTAAGSWAEGAAAEAARLATAAPAANLHVHLPPNVSAFARPATAVRRAAAEGVRALGASNFYDFSAYGAFGRAALQLGVYPLFGLELLLLDRELAAQGMRINDPDNPGRVYLCGRGAARLDRPGPVAQRLLAAVRRRDAARLRRMIDRLNGALDAAGIPVAIDERTLTERLARRCAVPPEAVILQERHLAEALQRELFRRYRPERRGRWLGRLLGMREADMPTDPERIQTLLRARLMKAGGPAYVAEKFPPVEDGMRCLRELGAVVCYPIIADYACPLTPFEADPRRLAAALSERGIPMVELITVRNDLAVVRRYAEAMRAAGLVVSAGTEHNARAKMPLVPTAAGGRPLPAALRALFWEGACIVAAHQFLARRGEPGLTAEACGATAVADRRRRQLAKLGEALIAACRPT